MVAATRTVSPTETGLAASRPTTATSCSWRTGPTGTVKIGVLASPQARPASVSERPPVFCPSEKSNTPASLPPGRLRAKLVEGVADLRWPSRRGAAVRGSPAWRG